MKNSPVVDITSALFDITYESRMGFISTETVMIY